MPFITQAARAFEMVARCGSVRKAADRVNASPSAVNRQILNLEMEIGVPLFERHARGMRVTRAGQTVLEHIRNWQQDDLKLRSEVKAMSGETRIRIRIGIMECLAADFLPKAFARFKEAYSEAALELTVGGTKEITASLLLGEIDLAVAFNVPRDEGLKIIEERQVPLGAVMSINHPLATKPELQLDDLTVYPLALADDRLTIGPVVNTLLERLRRPVGRVVRTNSVTALKSIVERADAISLLTSVDVYKEVAEGRLTFTQINGARMYEVLSISARDGKALSSSARKMATILCSALAEVG